MTLAFTQEINNKPTYFIHKIWSSLYYFLSDFDKEFEKYNNLSKEKFNKSVTINPSVFHPKRHTIRRDSKNRWKAGNKIHPVINNRTPQRFQFAPILKCISVQAIEIIWTDEENQRNEFPAIFIDGEILDQEAEKNLALNDGFESVAEFYKYFNTDFYGKIIHWTNLKY